MYVGLVDNHASAYVIEHALKVFANAEKLFANVLM